MKQKILVFEGFRKYHGTAYLQYAVGINVFFLFWGQLVKNHFKFNFYSVVDCLNHIPFNFLHKIYIYIFLHKKHCFRHGH